MLATLALLSALAITPAPEPSEAAYDPPVAANPTPQAAPPAISRFAIYIGADDKINCLRCGGEWTERNPFYVRFPIGTLVYVQAACALKQVENAERASKAVRVSDNTSEVPMD